MQKDIFGLYTSDICEQLKWRSLLKKYLIFIYYLRLKSGVETRLKLDPNIQVVFELLSNMMNIHHFIEYVFIVYFWPQSRRVTELKSHRNPTVLRIQVGEIFLCLISINSPNRFACRGIIFQ